MNDGDDQVEEGLIGPILLVGLVLAAVAVAAIGAVLELSPYVAAFVAPRLPDLPAEAIVAIAIAAPVGASTGAMAVLGGLAWALLEGPAWFSRRAEARYARITGEAHEIAVTARGGVHGPQASFDPVSDERRTAAAVHLAGLFLGVIPSLIAGRSDSAFVRDHARRALRVQLSAVLILGVGSLFTCGLSGFLVVLWWPVIVMDALRAWRGEPAP